MVAGHARRLTGRPRRLHRKPDPQDRPGPRAAAGHQPVRRQNILRGCRRGVCPQRHHAPLYLAFTVLAQSGYAATPLTAALYFAPLALAFSATSLAASRLTRYGAR
jgi:hypothetical protein